MSQPEQAADLGGLDELRGRRERRVRRTAPPPRHPKVLPEVSGQPAPASTGTADEISTGTVDEITREVSHEVDDETTRTAPEPAPAEVTPEPVRPAAVARPAAPAVATAGTPLPELEVDLADPALMMYSPTVLSIPAAIMARFEVARPAAASHTALVLDALRAHAAKLPDLVLAKRPGPKPGDLFPLRAVPGGGQPLRPQPLRIRPTVGELQIMDVLTGWVNKEIRRRRPGGRKVSRSEVVAVALDAYLPAESARRRKTD